MNSKEKVQFVLEQLQIVETMWAKPLGAMSIKIILANIKAVLHDCESLGNDPKTLCNNLENLIKKRLEEPD